MSKKWTFIAGMALGAYAMYNHLYKKTAKIIIKAKEEKEDKDESEEN